MNDDHKALVLRRDLRTMSSQWPALVSRLSGGGGTDTSGVHAAPGSRMPINADVSDVIAQVTEWAMFLARVLIDETDWIAPADTSTPSLLNEVCYRVGHFTAHEDEALAAGVLDDADRLTRLVLATVQPSRRKVMRLGIPCTERAITATGDAPPCPGQYTMAVMPDERLADFVCTKDKAHRMTPEQWFRGQRGRAFDERAVDELVRSALRVG